MKKGRKTKCAYCMADMINRSYGRKYHDMCIRCEHALIELRHEEHEYNTNRRN